MSSALASRRGSRPRVRRLSRHELDVIFPPTARRSARKSSTSVQTDRRDLTNLRSCPTPSDQRRSSSHQPSSEQATETDVKKKQFFRRRWFRLWCLILSLLVGFILLSAIITTIVLLLIKPTTTTTTTSTTQTTATTTTSTSATSSLPFPIVQEGNEKICDLLASTSSSTSSTSSSSSTSTSSTSSSTSSSSSTSTSTSSSSTSSTSSTSSSSSSSTSTSSSSSTSSSTSSTTSTTSTTTTTRNPQLAAFNDSTLVEDTWTFLSYSIFSTSTSFTLQYLLTLDNKHEWYLDDVSATDSSSTDMISNGDFEGSTLGAWTTGTCSPTPPGLSNSRAKSSLHSYRNRCQSQWMTLQQTFNATVGQMYNISFWFYLDRVNSGAGSGSNGLIVNLI